MIDYNVKGHIVYTNLGFLMSDIIMQRYDTEREDDKWIFWNEVAGIIESSELSEKGKEICFMIVHDYFTGRLRGRDNFWDARVNVNHYEHMDFKWTEREYCFREGSQLGLHWQSLIDEQKAFRLKKVVKWLDTFCKAIAPRVEYIIERYQEDYWSDWAECLFYVKREECEEPFPKNTNIHSTRLEKCLEYLKAETERLIAIREERFEEKRKNII